MITIKDLFELTGDKMINDIQKSFIRRKYAPDVAERMCVCIDRQEKAEHSLRFLNEYNEWLLNMQRQQQYIQQFLLQNFK